MLRFFVIVILCSLLTVDTYSADIFTDTLQSGDKLRHNVVMAQAPVSADVADHNRKHFWRAAA